MSAELAKRYCNTLQSSAIEAKSCPMCGMIPPPGIDIKQCRNCNHNIAPICKAL